MIAIALLALLTFANSSPDDAVAAAVEHSPDVAAAQARVDRAAATLATDRSVIVPSFKATYQQGPQGNPPGPNVVSRTANVGLETSVENFLSYGTVARQNTMLLAAARADALAADREERVKATALYYDALKARAVLDARVRALALALAQRDAAAKRFAAGDGPRLDVVRAEVGIAKATADVESARGSDADATEALALETGRSSADYAATNDGPESDAVDSDATIAAQRALEARAEIASAVATERAAEATSRLAAANAQTLTVGAGFANGTDSGVPVHAPTVDVSLTVPLGAGRHDRVRIEEANVAQARANVEAAKRAIALQVGAAARAVVTLRRAADASSRVRAEAELEVTTTELGFRNGAASSLDVRSADAAYAQALVDERSARYDLAKARATLALEVGA